MSLAGSLGGIGLTLLDFIQAWPCPNLIGHCKLD